MELNQAQLAALLPNVATHMRGTLGNILMAAVSMAPPEEREKDAGLDTLSARLDRSYFQLLRMINNLSAAAYLAEDTPFPRQDGDIVDFIGEICDQAGDLAAMVGVELRFVCAAQSHICAFAPEPTEQLLYHLLSNALKFTPAGGTVTVELRFNGNRMTLTVTDTGCGIAEDMLPTLFERHLHPEKLVPAPCGMGLGLPLCRCIAERQGGRLMAESRVGQGSRFTVSLPNERCGEDVAEKPFDYTGGFSRPLMALSDVLPVEAFGVRYLN